MGAQFKFEIGDVVQLKSGSPLMTITKQISRNHPINLPQEIPFYQCDWIKEDGNKEHNVYQEEVLKKV